MSSNCPHCSTALALTKFSDGGVAYACKTCGGLSIGVALLKRKMDPEVIAKIWRAASSEGKKGRNKCPSCPKNMALVAVPSAKGSFELDVCTTCQHIWFDKSELEKIPKNPQGTKPLATGTPSSKGYAPLGGNMDDDGLSRTLDVVDLAIDVIDIAFTDW